MAYDGVIEDVRTAIALEEPKRIPVFALSEEFDVKWYGKWDYETVCQDGDKEENYYHSSPTVRGGWFHKNYARYPRYVFVDGAAAAPTQ